MTLGEALAAVGEGARVTSAALPLGSVLKREGWSNPRVVFEETGSGFDFVARAEHETANWRKVEGWLTYG